MTSRCNRSNIPAEIKAYQSLTFGIQENFIIQSSCKLSLKRCLLLWKKFSFSTFNHMLKWELCTLPTHLTHYYMKQFFALNSILQPWGAINQGALHLTSQGVILWTRSCPLDCLPEWLNDWNGEIIVDPFGWLGCFVWFCWAMNLSPSGRFPMPLFWNKLLFLMSLSDLVYVVVTDKNGDTTLKMGVRKERWWVKN